MPTLSTAISRFRRLDRGTRIRCALAIAAAAWTLGLLQGIGVIPS